MNRRSFFARTFGALIAAIVSPRVVASDVLMFKGVPVVFDEHQPSNRITTATYSFWKAQPQYLSAYDNLRASMREVYNQCRSDDM